MTDDARLEQLEANQTAIVSALTELTNAVKDLRSGTADVDDNDPRVAEAKANLARLNAHEMPADLPGMKPPRQSAITRTEDKDGNWVINIPDANEEWTARRADLAKQLWRAEKSQDERDQYVKTGPMGLFYTDPSMLREFPDHVKHEMVSDVIDTVSYDDGLEFSREVFKSDGKQ